MSRLITVVDTETSGFVPSVHEIIEIAAVKVEHPGWIVRDVFYRRLTPLLDVPKEAAAVNGYSQESWASTLPMSADTIREFSRFVDGSQWAGSAPRFDFDFINHDREHFILPPFCLSTHRLIDIGSIASPFCFADLCKSGGLEAISDLLGVNKKPPPDWTGIAEERIGPHTAMGDVVRTLRCLSILMDCFVDRARSLLSNNRCSFCDTVSFGGIAYHHDCPIKLSA